MDKYEVIKLLGQGAFGKAFLVKAKDNNTRVVVKEIKTAKMHQKEREAALKEVTLMDKMKHPNIVKFLDSFEEGQSLFIVMEYCDGGDLMHRINMQHGVYFTEEQVLDWFVQICLGLKHIHDRKILHRDIKTQFEGNNLHQLVVRICRGRYAPVNSRYTYDLRMLLAQLFKVNPRDRPSINSILRKKFLEKRIRKYLSPELIKEEFSHTVIHRKKSPASRFTAASSQSAPTIQKAKYEMKQLPRPLINKKPPPDHYEWKALAVVNRPNMKQISNQLAAAPRIEGRYEHYHGYLDHMERRPNDLIPPPVPHYNNQIEDYRQKVNHDPLHWPYAVHEEYIQRKLEAQEYKIKAEKQLGIRPRSSDHYEYTPTPDVQARQSAKQQARKKGAADEEYCQRLKEIRQQYQHEVKEIKGKMEIKENHPGILAETYHIEKVTELQEQNKDKQPHQVIEEDLKQMRLQHQMEKKALALKHKVKGIKFEIMLDEELTHEDSQQEEELDMLNKTLTHEQGEILKQKKWQFTEAGNILEDLANKTLEVTSSQMEATSKSDEIMVMNADIPKNRNHWEQKPPDTLLNALQAAQLSSVCQTMSEDQIDDTLTPLKPTEENNDPKSNTASEIDLDKARLEPRSDDDDTNFEESEDELTEQLVESLQDLVHPEEKIQGSDGPEISQRISNEEEEQKNEGHKEVLVPDSQRKSEESFDEKNRGAPDPGKNCTEQNGTTARE
ncbi:serine/threonine-protein kinase Nek5-like isoform X3 [Chiloscyllium plagiosum]|uniref:serine/threonine-protein kinase Nek5-like isoform X3 n=1 Tax=Chiloscyllium plagiosum TaxID=36176 RepID=UPI001CB85F9F|nr:serine/threonine-protein kinase Nek5-like isoform X3 [Chiloscyllium plagiosum]